MYDRAEAVDQGFINSVSTGKFSDSLQTLSSKGRLSHQELVELFETQVISRHLDLMSRRSKGKTFYSIGSSGHEALAAIAKAARPSDMAFLHYRDAAFLIQRKRQAGHDMIRDMVLSFAAAKADPVSGGRHKVLGGRDIYVPPQTSTIASHLPKAMGAAHAVGISKRHDFKERVLPQDAVILCSFGDASANHSTAQGAINAAAWAAYQNSPMPLVFICEDNGIGISVRTPQGWIKASYENRPGLKYMAGDGTDLHSVYEAASAAIGYARTYRKPVFLHLKTIRLMGHAGADIEAMYADISHIEAIEAQDPLLKSAHYLIQEGILSAAKILSLYEETRQQIVDILEEVAPQPKLSSAKEVIASLVPSKTAWQQSPKRPSIKDRAAIFAKDKRALAKPQPLARHINFALADALLQYENAAVFGEDVARKGGVYSVTTGLQEKFGPLRVWDTLLDEQTILGLAIGMAHNGNIPIPEIQFLAYLHNAEDQVRGEAATLSFFSNSQFTNPMVIRIAGLGYQRGFGGHFHNDNSFNVLRDIPGIIVACPSNGADAGPMLRECVRLAHEERRVVVFLEPIALYMTSDLHEPGDNAWLSSYNAPKDQVDISLGVLHQFGRGTDLCILSYGNGYYLSRQAEQRLRKEQGLKCRVIDLRWLHPLDEKAILKAIKPCKNILIVDECRRTGSLGEQLVTLLQENAVTAPIARVTAADSFIPLGPAAYEVLPSVEDIMQATLRLYEG